MPEQTGQGFWHEPDGYGAGPSRVSTLPAGACTFELTHAWQIANESFTPGYYCRARSTAAGTAGGDMSAYALDRPEPICSFGTEQQASIVEHWFAVSGATDDKNRQRECPPRRLPSGLEPEKAHRQRTRTTRYIRDNIRTGVA